jgi:hypothetical protein
MHLLHKAKTSYILKRREYKPIEQYKQCAFNLMMVDLEHHSYVCNRVVRAID